MLSENGFLFELLIISMFVSLFGCSTAALKQQMVLNFESVVSDQLFTVVLASCK